MLLLKTHHCDAESFKLRNNLQEHSQKRRSVSYTQSYPKLHFSPTLKLFSLMYLVAYGIQSEKH